LWHLVFFIGPWGGGKEEPRRKKMKRKIQSRSSSLLNYYRYATSPHESTSANKGGPPEP
jgi:hypothetical protein